MGSTNVSRRRFFSTAADTAGTALAVQQIARGADDAKKKTTTKPTVQKQAKPTPKVKKVNVGLIGVGGRGSHHLSQLLKLPGVKITAICDIDPTHLSRAVNRVEQAQGHRPKRYDAGPEDYKNLLDDKNVDAVSSALPCDLHAKVYLDAIAAGKHLYGEKPMALTVADCNAIVAAQEKHPKQVVQIGFQWRADPKNQELVKRVRSGEIGELFDARGARNSTRVIGRPEEGARVWLGRRARSGDWMLEQACHDWDLFNWYVGARAVRAAAFGRRDLLKAVDPDRDVTDFYKAVVEYPGGVVLSWLHDWQCPHRDGGAFSRGYRQIAGTKGGIDIDSGKIFPRTPKGKIGKVKLIGHDPTPESFAAFLDSVRNDTPPVSGVYNGRDAVLVGLMVRTAVDLKRTVTLQEILAES